MFVEFVRSLNLQWCSYCTKMSDMISSRYLWIEDDSAFEIFSILMISFDAELHTVLSYYGQIFGDKFVVTFST